MNWKIKAITQKIIARLPGKLSYKLYYIVQKKFGVLNQTISPVGGLSSGVRVFEHISNNNCEPENKVFFEVGTGTVPLMPLSFFLMGCEKTITVDLNPYLNDTMFRQCLDFILNNPEIISEIFGNRLKENRFNSLLNHIKNNDYCRNDILELCRIDYKSPTDARNTGLEPNSINYFVSKNVFEHIPIKSLEEIISEANRIITPDGLFINHIDYIDHYSYSDKNISKINFLKYSDKQWNFYANNKYAYTNRMRHKDYIELLKKLHHMIINEAKDTDENILKQLNNNSIKLHKSYEEIDNKELAIMSAWIISQINN